MCRFQYNQLCSGSAVLTQSILLQKVLSNFCNASIFIIYRQQLLNQQKMAYYGYDKERFTNLTFDEFDCIICSQIARDPLECQGCGKIFCKLCINDWIKKQPDTKCPNRCKTEITTVKSKALIRMYNSLNIKCSNKGCDKVLTLQKIQEHEKLCLKPDCFNFKNCNKKADDSIISNKPCCSNNCYILSELCNNFGNTKKLYQIITSISGQSVPNTIVMGSSDLKNLCWDTSKFGANVIISENNTKAYLKEENYVFRTVTGNIGFTSGVNYWEIIADPRTQNQLKIGITGNKDFQMNGAFCDQPFGFAFYGLGQLRNGSNASGAQYGKRFKKSGVLGVCLDMINGTLSFSLDGENMGVAFAREQLKKGPYYPAVAILHSGGCTIRGGVPLPACFKK